MSTPEKVTASYSAVGISTVLIPKWRQEPRVEARTDGKDEITVVVTKIHPNELWHLVRLRKGILCAISQLTAPVPGGRLRRTDFDAVVQLPLGKLESIRVLTNRLDATES